MVQYVYALHDFIPENDDEVSFKAGERIEVVEKDDLYGDGWWQGRNLLGKVGLFPQSYTQPAPAVLHDPSERIPDESGRLSPTAEADSPSATRTPSAGLVPLIEEPEPSQSTGKATPNGEVMRATLTDVQKAIEQLGKQNDTDGARSFTFSSARDGDTTDHDTGDESDMHEGEDWYKATRQKLAERARQQVEEARARQVIHSRASIPPIDVDISDESANEDGDEPYTSETRRNRPHIPEAIEELEGELRPLSSTTHVQSSLPMSKAVSSDQSVVPSPVNVSFDLPTATQTSFPPQEVLATLDADHPLEMRNTVTLDTPSDSLSGLLVNENSADISPALLPASEPLPAYVLPTKTSDVSSSFVDASTALPRAQPSSTPVASLLSPSSPTETAAPSLISQPRIQSSTLSPSSTAFQSDRSGKHPNDWTVEEVIDWLKARGFDDSVCDKFTEQEITGDVLLDLDVNILKSEIGIVAFGKRMRIANAIAELRRPPSAMSEHPPISTSPLVASPLPGSSSFRSHSQSQSVTTTTTRHSGLHTPASIQKQFAGLDAEKEEPPDSFGFDPVPRAQVDHQATFDSTLDAPAAKLGRPRPSQLRLSPSDSAVGSTVKAVSDDTPDSVDSDRAILSEDDAASEQKPRRSSPSLPKQTSLRRSKSKDEAADVNPPHIRKRSADTSKLSSDRHSLFGSAFTSTLGRHRKPPPRYSGAEADSPEKSGLSLARLVPGSGRKSSGRPQTSEGSIPVAPRDTSGYRDGKRDSRDSSNSKERKDPALLRKRTTSTAGSPVLRDASSTKSPTGDRKYGVGVTLKAGQSIFQQIGTPDHNGWMRKKGERYNVWKSRYFVLKGPHLYWLRSNSPTEVRIKGYVNTVGYRIIADEKIDPGKYGFKLTHETEKSHMFSSDEQSIIREWMKALMKAAIDRDYSRPVISSVNIPTIPLAVAQAMNPAPRPPSPTARAATQKALRRENTSQLSTRDAQILMGGVPGMESNEHARLESMFVSNTAASAVSNDTATSVPSLIWTPVPDTPKSVPPSRPSRELRRLTSASTQSDHALDLALVEWVNNHVPRTLQLSASDSAAGPLCIGLTLLRLAESIKGTPASPPVPDTAFPVGPDDDKLEGLFRLFDFLLDNDVRMGSVSINDVRQGRRDKVTQLLKALRAWEDKRRAITRSVGKGGLASGGLVATAL